MNKTLTLFNRYEPKEKENTNWRVESTQREVIDSLIGIKERFSSVFSSFPKEYSTLANRRIMQVASSLQKFVIDNEISISFDCYTESCIDIKVIRRPDVVLSVYINEPDEIDDGIENVEVAYLTYKESGHRRTINNTLDFILKRMEEIL